MGIDKAITYFLNSLEIDQLSTHTIKAYSQDLKQFEINIQKKDLNNIDYEDFEMYF